MEQYPIKNYHLERQYDSHIRLSDIRHGCANNGVGDTEQIFDTREEALKALKKYPAEVRRTGKNSFAVTEFNVYEYTYADEESLEWDESSDNDIVESSPIEFVIYEDFKEVFRSDSVRQAKEEYEKRVLQDSFTDLSVTLCGLDVTFEIANYC